MTENIVTISNPMLTLKEAATLMGVSTKSIQRAIDRGELPAHRVGHSVRVTAGALEDFVTPYNPANPVAIKVAA